MIFIVAIVAIVLAVMLHEMIAEVHRRRPDIDIIRLIAFLMMAFFLGMGFVGIVIAMLR